MADLWKRSITVSAPWLLTMANNIRQWRSYIKTMCTKAADTSLVCKSNPETYKSIWTVSLCSWNDDKTILVLFLHSYLFFKLSQKTNHNECILPINLKWLNQTRPLLMTLIVMNSVFTNSSCVAYTVHCEILMTGCYVVLSKYARETLIHACVISNIYPEKYTLLCWIKFKCVCAG